MNENIQAAVAEYAATHTVPAYTVSQAYNWLDIYTDDVSPLCDAIVQYMDGAK